MNLLSNHKGKKSLIALALAAALTGCNDGENAKPAPAHDDHDHGHEPAPAVELHSRLVVSELSAEGNVVHVVDVNELKTIDTFTLDNALWRLKTSPEGRYVMALQRNESVIQTIDSGIAAEAHGDHYHLHADAPAFLDTKITHSRPTHFDVAGNEVAIFFDGNHDAGINSAFHVYNDESIATGVSVAHHEFNHAQHGTAQVFGEYVFTGVITAEERTTSLPDKIQALHRHGDHFHVEATSVDSCELLHGSAQVTTHVAFGCKDGVMLTSINGEEVVFEKAANPENLAADARFGTVKGFKGSEKFLAIAGKSLQAYSLDPTTKAFTEINWKSADEGLLAYLATDEAFVVLNNEGKLKIFEAAKNFQNPTITNKLWETLPTLEEGQRFQLVHDKRTGHFFVATPVEKRILEIDPAHPNEVESHELAYYPNQLAWAGTTQEEHHH